MTDQEGFRDSGCCEGLQRRTPLALFNRPGLGEIGYRMGAYRSFRESMLAGLSALRQSDLATAEFRGLQTRSNDDFTIALIDAWAVVGDVLTFYLERTAQEHYLPTATERRSVGDLVQLIGYRLQPGVAATTSLAFSIETMPGAPQSSRPVPMPGLPDRVPIRAGIRVQSIPNPGELPQTFETVEEIEALADWNVLTPRHVEPRVPKNNDKSTWLEGVGLSLAVGDTLLFVADNWGNEEPWARWDLRAVSSVEVDPVSRRTHVRWDGALTNLAGATSVSVFVMRHTASLFGYNAPDPQLFSKEVLDRLELSDDDWAFNEISIGGSSTTIRLSSVIPGVVPGGWLVLKRQVRVVRQDLMRITGVREQSRSAYGVSAQLTSIVTDRRDSTFNSRYDRDNVRTTRVLLGSEALTLADYPITDPVMGNTIALNRTLDAIEGQRSIIVRGRRAVARARDGLTLTLVDDDGDSGDISKELATVLSVEVESDGRYRTRMLTGEGIEGTVVHQPGELVFEPASDQAPYVAEEAVCVEVRTDGAVSTLQLQDRLAAVFDRTSTEILGNVARATHGETVEREVLGSGDGSKPFQQFTLRKQPLTYVRGTQAGAIEPTLEIWVNGVRWTEVATFFGCGPRDRVYVVRIDDESRTTVQFGDGKNGTRLPTGRENVVATYRTGSGTEGNLKPGQISLLIDRPLGVRDVSNPRAPEGAAPRQEMEDARENAPRTVLTLNRIVSLQDYEDFARNFVGIEKAAAVWTWNGQHRGVLITVAGQEGRQLEEGDLVYTDLLAAMAAAGSPHVPFVVKSYRPGTFRLSASLRVASDRNPDTVIGGVWQALTDRFSFRQRSFGQMVTLSDIYAAIHSVDGVVAADVNHLYRGTDARLNPYITVEAPVDGTSPEVPGAELLTIDAASRDELEVRI